MASKLELNRRVQLLERTETVLRADLAKERKAKEVEQAAKNVLRIELATVRTGLAWAKRPLWRKAWDYLKGTKR